MRISLAGFLLFFLMSPAVAQGGHTLWGDIKVDESQLTKARASSFTIVLYSEGGQLVMRQTVPANGRYRFLDLRNGRYELAVEYENQEIARMTVSVNAPFKTDFRQDIELQWRNDVGSVKPGVIDAASNYSRSDINQSLYRKALESSEKKAYEKAIGYLKQVVASDRADFPAWEQLGTMNFILKNFDEAEQDYLKALQLQANYKPALVNLGRLRIALRNFNGAIEVLVRAVKTDPKSAQANYFLGEAYLQVKLGSKAVPYLNEAIRLDPAGMAEAHLRLAALYNARGMKDKAAAEYSAFLKQRPDYPERKKLEAYIESAKVP
jgi:tetratricopeptide (TPR) repeat protein